MIDALREIQAMLSQGAYRNEEHVRLNLVARVLQELGWNIWDPREVNPEWSVAPSEDVTKVDLALFVNRSAPSVFIEVKAVGRIFGNLAAAEKQVRDYNRNNTALFSVITDGQEWRFYYSQTGGEFAQKLFKVVDLVRDDLAEVERTLSKFLRKEEIDNGNAKAEAEKHLQLNQRQRAMDDCLPAARRQVQEPPYPSLPESLATLARERGVTITRDEAIAYIAIAGEVTVRSVATVPEPGGILSMGVTAKPVNVAETLRTVAPDNLGELKHAHVLEGSLGGVSETKWNKLVASGVRLALNSGIAFRELEAALDANLEEGNRGDSGFAIIPGTGVSIQGMDAIQCAGNLFVLARMLRCPLRVRFK